jgi:tetratricopeptide (TPR) repeat protein
VIYFMEGFIKMKNKSAACNLRTLFAVLLLTAAVAFGQDGEGGYDAPYFQADFTQDLNSWTSALVNPALLFRVNQMHASMAFYRWGLDRDNMGYQDFSLFYPYRYRHTFGLTVLHARNSMPRTRWDNNSDQAVEVSQVAYQDLWAIGNYGVKVLPWFWAGANVKLRTQAQFGKNAVSKIPGLDVGLYFNPIDHYRIGDIGISLTAQDILPTQTPWKYDMGYENAPDFSSDLITASRGRAGVRYSGLNDNLVVSGELLVDNAFRDVLASLLSEDFKKQLMSGGMENLDDIKNRLKELSPLAYRWGFHVKYMFIPQIWFKGGWTNNNVPYLGFNYNILYPLPEMINIFNIDYYLGWGLIDQSANMGDERGMVMMLKASVDFGRTREQKESKRLYDKLVVAPMDVYQEAMRLYTAGKYWEASFAYGKLISLYPTFYLNDKAVYYMGDCYKHLYMNQTSREVFRAALDEYTTSDMRAFYLYGIMSLDYREENYDEAMRNYGFIVNLYPETEIRGEAEYLAGEIEFLRGSYEQAKAHFEAVKPSDPSYLYALYTLGVINYQTDRLQASVQNLKAVIDDTTSKTPDRMLQDAAAVKLGHTYFEMGDKLREAVEAYSLVKEDAVPHGDEALLGMTWAWVKAGQPQIALQKADRLVQLHPQSPFVPEAHLLRGYALMLMKRHADAIPAFERALAACEGKFLTPEDVKIRKVQNDKAADDFAPEADRIKKNAMRKPTPRSVEERTELYKSYESFSTENKEFFHYRITAKSHNNFFMRKEEIIEDATFALAKATNYIKNRGTSAEIEKLKRGEDKLDAEIEKLRQQLDNAD